MLEHIAAETRGPTFSRHFQMDFCQWKLLYIDFNFTEICPNWQYPSLLWIMACHRSHYLNQWWAGLMTHMGISRPLQVNHIINGPSSKVIGTHLTIAMYNHHHRSPSCVRNGSIYVCCSPAVRRERNRSFFSAYPITTVILNRHCWDTCCCLRQQLYIS